MSEDQVALPSFSDLEKDLAVLQDAVNNLVGTLDSVLIPPGEEPDIKCCEDPVMPPISQAMMQVRNARTQVRKITDTIFELNGRVQMP